MFDLRRSMHTFASSLATEHRSWIFHSRWNRYSMYQWFTRRGCDTNYRRRFSRSRSTIEVRKTFSMSEKKKKTLEFFRLHDIILRVNDIDFTQIEHQAAVDALKAAGNHVHLVSSDWKKNFSMTFSRLHSVSSSISSARDGRNSITKTSQCSFRLFDSGWNQPWTCQRVCSFRPIHVDQCLRSFRDYGIFVTNIIPGGITDKNGRLRVGDRLMHVQSMVRSMIFLSLFIVFFLGQWLWSSVCGT